VSGTAPLSADPARTVLAAALVIADRTGVDRDVVVAIALAHGLSVDNDDGFASFDDTGAADETLFAPIGWELGRAHEGSEVAADRKQRGAFYTPLPLVTGLTRLVLTGRHHRVPRVCDPMCGAGGFLLAAAEHLRSDGVDVEEIGPNLVGFDVDANAVMTARLALGLWLASAGGDPMSPTIVVADAIHGEPPAEVEDGFDAIVGNPPFLGQLKSKTARSETDRLSLDEARGYADAATIAWERSRLWLRPSGRMTMVLPQSVLSARDAAPARDEAAGTVVGMWVDDGDVFDASVKVIAPLVVSDPGESVFPVPLFSGEAVEQVGFTRSLTWSGMLADRQGVPAFGGHTRGTVSDIATASADFRRWFYDMAVLVAEHENGPDHDSDVVRVVTSGLIDPNRALWGVVDTKIGGRRWRRPVVTRDQLADLGESDRLRPKVLVASQTRVIEAIVDELGMAVGLTPVITVTPLVEADLWRLAAVLLSPLASVWARRQAAGSGLSREAVRLSTTVVGSLPLPSASFVAWTAAADVLAAGTTDTSGSGVGAARRETLLAAAHLMQEAYGLPDHSVFAWWESQLPRER